MSKDFVRFASMILIYWIGTKSKNMTGRCCDLSDNYRFKPIKSCYIRQGLNVVEQSANIRISYK